jgi:hypothetical protein
MSMLRKYLLAAGLAGALCLLTATSGLAATANNELVNGTETGAGTIGVFVTPGGLLPCGGSCFLGTAQGELEGTFSARVFVNWTTGHVTGDSFFLRTESGIISGTVDPATIALVSSSSFWGFCTQTFSITSAAVSGPGTAAIRNVTLTHYGLISRGGQCIVKSATISGTVVIYT